MRFSKFIIWLVSILFFVSATGTSYASEVSNSEVNSSKTNEVLTIKHKKGSDSFDLRKLEEGKTHRVRISDGSYRSITEISKSDNRSEKLVAVSDNDKFEIFTPVLDGSTLAVDGIDATGLIDDVGHVNLSLDSNISHQVEFKTEVPIKDGASTNATGNDSGLVELSILSLTVQPMPMIIAPELPTYTRIRYQTFIPERLVPVPTIGCWASWVPGADLYFAGNNRTWSPGSTNNKTAFDFRANWLTGKIDTITRSVAKTQVVRVFPLTGAEYLGESATASSSSMVVSLTGSQSASQITFQMRQDISNPLCLSLGIYYDVLISVRQSGSYSLSGEVRKVPNHELYIRDSNSTSWTTVYRFTNVGFNCLTPGAICIDPISKSGTIQ